jgi:hypothetical protein
VYQSIFESLPQPSSNASHLAAEPPITILVVGGRSFWARQALWPALADYPGIVADCLDVRNPKLDAIAEN